MPHIKVYIHFVWSTKNREQFLSDKTIRYKLWQHIKENAKLKGIYIDCINGYKDHCHCLISLGVDQTMSEIMQLIKGESSFWINKEKLISSKFEWQDKYFAASVSESLIERTRNYIKGQEKHHEKESFQLEYDSFLQKCGFQRFSDG
jgi:REP element-mobilizing transposase RayT